MEIQHFSHKKHPLMLMEELENDGENEVACSGCEKPVSCGPAYNCSQCKFFLHKLCAELPREIQHPVHPNHTLRLRASTSSELGLCDACGRGCKRCFVYTCHDCYFDMDIECVSASLPTKPDDGHQHEFVPIFQQFHFTCELCGEDRNNAAQVCRICQILADTLCALKPSTIKITADRHLLTLIYSLGKVIKEHDDVLCNLCYKKLNPNYAGYYCQKCDFVAHLGCAPRRRHTIDSSIDLIEDGIDFEVKEELEEIQHFDHEHELIISRNEVEVHDHKLCEGCVRSISVPFYSCEQCDYFLHSTCARLPSKKRYLSHPHLLTLSARGNNIIVDNYLVFCDACDQNSHGFAYKCHDCHYNLDIRCSSIPKTFKHEGHQHSLFLAISSVERCNACDESVRWLSPGLFVCTECKFALDFKCATLPPKVKYEYHPHFLSFTHIIVENDSEEYYCLICGEEMNPDHWLYYCAECNFTAHSKCIVGRNPYIKYGKTFISDLHQHSLAFVLRTRVSPPCDACGQTFNEETALNCTQCKFIVHQWCAQHLWINYE